MHAINNSLSFQPALDAGDLVHVESTLTKGQLARLLTTLQGDHSLTKACLKDILKLLSTIFPSCSLPKFSKYVGIFPRLCTLTFNDINDYEYHCFCSDSVPLKHYFSPDSYTELHVCPNGCIAYIGKESDLKICSTCNEPRFLKCNEKSCKKKSYDSCNHAMKNRIPRRRLHYFPLIPRLIRIVRTTNYIACGAIRYASNVLNVSFCSKTRLPS